MRPCQVLLVEDNAADILLTEEAFRESSGGHELRVLRDGEEAVAYLAWALAHDEPLPDLILLDLNLPGKSGHEVLRTVKRHPGLRRVPVVVLTTSTAQQDIEAALEAQANCYIVKPPDLDGFLRMIRGVTSFWLGLAVLPARGRRQPIMRGTEEQET